MNDVINPGATHLEPWSSLLSSGWPVGAGPLPTEQAVQQALDLGAAPGSKVGLAWAMYCRAEGASQAEVTLVCDGPQRHAATDAARAGKLEFMARKRDDGATAYFLGPMGSQPGGPGARPIELDKSGIPDVSREELIEAIATFDRDLRGSEAWVNWEQNRAHKYAIRHEGRLYPVKQIISQATHVPTASFSGGEAHANTYVRNRDLEVVSLADAQQQSLQAGLEGILESYQSNRTSKPFGADQALWKVFDAVKDDLERLPCISSRPDLSVTWSVGKGNWARVPWLAVFSDRETTSTQQGVYCAFLFREDMTGVYLALNQGVTEPKNRLGPQAGLKEVQLRADELRTTSRHLEAHGFDFEESLDLRTGPGRGHDYQRSTVFHKLYERGRVPDDEAIASDLEVLLNVYDDYLARKFQAGGNQHRLEEMKQRFLDRMPGFESFPASGPESAYGQQERNYKDELLQIFQEEIGPRLKQEPGSPEQEDQLAADIHGLLRRQLASIGQPQNLLTWRDYDFFNRIDPGGRRRFTAMLRDLLYGPDSTGKRVERFSESFKLLLEGTNLNVIPAWTRIMPSFFLMLAYPEQEIFVKTRPFNRAAQMALDLPPLATRSFDAEQYGHVMRVATTIREALEEWGWAPRDMIDVQSFIWVATSVPNDEDSEAVPAEEIDDDDDKGEVDRETVRNAYTEPSFDEIRRSVAEEGLRLSERLLRRYHLAIKSRGFVILSGISGTGKTWLAQAYARAVNAESLLVSVAPNWTTNEDLLGFLNPLDGVYHHTQFSRFLSRAAGAYAEAQQHGVEAQPFHLILDEMNLARVEYYFAKFLSSMELRASGRPALIELAPDQRVELTPNLSFVGTVNIDETTHGFSDKVYDRAQLIELDCPRELLVKHLGQEPYADVLMDAWDAVEETAPFAFRVLDEVRAYTSSATAMGVPWQEALDEQLLQKVLPKLKGSDPRVGEALEAIVRLSQDEFQLTHQKAQLMLYRFRRHGFTSYF